ncbi:MAG: CD225/dispanin family protein [Chitinophagales bacterium]|nr:CD225/dispanin family protein [Chitinophagales bacterium]
MSDLNDERKYFYSDGQRQFGPFTFQELADQRISRKTQVWFQGLENWTQAGQVPELSGLFAPPAPPPQQTYTPPPPAYGSPGTGYNPQGSGPYMPPPRPNYQSVNPPTPSSHYMYLIFSILSTLLCCLPLGIVGTVFSILSLTRWSEGDYDGSNAAANTSKNILIASVVLGFLTIIGYFAFIFMVGTGAALGSGF